PFIGIHKSLEQRHPLRDRRFQVEARNGPRVVEEGDCGDLAGRHPVIVTAAERSSVKGGGSGRRRGAIPKPHTEHVGIDGEVALGVSTASAFPIDGRPAMTTMSDSLNPLVIRSRSWKPVAIPTTPPPAAI